MTDASQELVQERRGRVLVLRLNRPEARNALTRSLKARAGLEGPMTPPRRSAPRAGR